MTVHRRDVLCGLGGLAATAALGDLGAQTSQANRAAAAGLAPQTLDLPRKSDFVIDPGYTYLNAAYTHPIPKVSMDAARRAAEGRGTLPPPTGGQSGTPKALFAELINAKPSEIAYVSSTSAGENLVVQALDLDRRFDGNVVTDGLHFEGALLHLMELKKQGLDVRVVKPTKEYRIDFKDLEKAVDKNTRLIEVSSASMYNGFQHDLKAVCDLAHANGAYVYADIIHSAGAEPFDVRRAAWTSPRARRSSG
jgi:selenocysteine lyase/cysteine desulfurase